MNNKIKSLIMIDEGFRDKMYIDTLGKPTIGFGFNLEKVKLPIGLAKEWLDILLDEIEYKLSNIISIWDNLTLERQYVLINMAYNLGIDGLNKFHGMIEAIEEEDYVRAEKEMADSLWDKQVPNRSQRLRKIMITGEFNE